MTNPCLLESREGSKASSQEWTHFWQAYLLTKGSQWCVWGGDVGWKKGWKADYRLLVFTAHTPPLTTALSEGIAIKQFMPQDSVSIILET